MRREPNIQREKEQSVSFYHGSFYEEENNRMAMDSHRLSFAKRKVMLASYDYDI